MDISDSFSIEAAPDDLWAMLSDVPSIAGMIPGAELIDQRPDGRYDGLMTVRFGPTKIIWQGTAAVTTDEAQRSVAIEATGHDRKEASHATVTMLVEVRPEGSGSSVRTDGSLDIQGTLGSLAKTAGVHVLGGLLAEFRSNLSARVQGPAAVPIDEPSAGGEPPAVEPARAAQAPPASGARLAWMAIVSAVRRVVHRRRRPLSPAAAEKRSSE